MDDTILSANTLPAPLHRRIHSDKVRIHEENGIIMLMPVGDSHAADTTPRPVRRPFDFDCMKGQIRMSDDFNEPLEDFKEYM